MPMSRIMSKRFYAPLPQPFDPCLYCVACGAEFPMHDPRDIYDEREDWTRLRKKRKNRVAYVSDQELEQTDFKRHPELWSFFYRTILDDPQSGSLRLSGISDHRSWGWYPLPAPLDIHKARIGGIPNPDGRHNVDFHMVNMLNADWNREKGQLIGYPIHVPCWLLLDRVIGHEIIRDNLRPFIQAVEGFWKDNSKLWEVLLTHSQEEDECYEKGQHWLKDPPKIKKKPNQRQRSFPIKQVTPKPWHEPGSPYRIPAIQDLIDKACQVKDGHRHPIIHNHMVSMMPIEIAVMIIDMIYRGQKHSQARINDTWNALYAFQWTLPDTYWQSRCNPELVFEIDDLAQSGKAVDWPYLCLGLEELLLDEDWYCNSGLNNRGRTMSIMSGIRKRFLVLLDA
ncbi:hypothetical protein P170DRAFT_427707 [Aspergillus steynii IBT 23096]|uniref:Uncharacterized protein n=1 Tax=Aspergillus steynii IBT 23096 TaxID=1392250 RepID=A0A2I2G0H4_9EURO|nr:uncharacterized protein P170DRAFT_427707 [Aspergillus steynii IBT 23096]PLB46385.1 hypothetical protein P170DRAFT_427707 [Aspergillus steynii IBT 23096]